MTTQPEALRLADALEAWALGKPTNHREAAAELRRLHAVNDELLEALKVLLNNNEYLTGEPAARAAIAKTEGQA
jgi:hypothetical protein